ncbi:hypothetical protein [Bradyrhizobium tunisiense]|uniref:hypothetical protein n=1 Tax=Bradyrhizobium tunisiense TaxID=3278709 RepID=UPI0035DB9EBE
MSIRLNVHFAASIFAVYAYLYSRDGEPQRGRNNSVPCLVVSRAAPVSVSFRLLRLHVIP